MIVNAVLSGRWLLFYLNTIKSWITFPHPCCCRGFLLHFVGSLLFNDRRLFPTFSSHFSLGQPEIMILKSLRWFIHWKEGLVHVGPLWEMASCRSAGIYNIHNNLKVTDGRRPDLTHYSRSKSIQRIVMQHVWEVSPNQLHAVKRMERIASFCCAGDKPGSQDGSPQQSVSLNDCSVSQDVNYGKLK